VKIFTFNLLVRLLSEFLDKGWKLGSIDHLLKKIRKTGTFDRQPGSGRPRSVCVDEHIEQVEDLMLSQEESPKMHRSTRKISRETGIHIHRLSVHRIIHRDLQTAAEVPKTTSCAAIRTPKPIALPV